MSEPTTTSTAAAAGATITPPDPLRVMLVDDHPVVRSGLSALLDAFGDITVVGALADGREAVERYSELAPDVVLMDLSMPGMDGIEATAQICRADPSARVVVLTSFGERRRIVAALDAGACGYLLKDSGREDVVSAVHAAAAGGSPIDPRVASVLLAERHESRGATGSTMSARELEVLRLVAEGRINKDIARELGIAEKTVKTHLTRIYERIGVQDRTQAAIWAERSGLFKS
ncbi:MAG: response regulator [Frankiales bacterium]|nr:response regulator [Frankiales bacterium]